MAYSWSEILFQEREQDHQVVQIFFEPHVCASALTHVERLVGFLDLCVNHWYDLIGNHRG